MPTGREEAKILGNLHLHILYILLGRTLHIHNGEHPGTELKEKHTENF